MSDGAPWVNWQQFAALNESETQRIADDARAARDAQQAEVNRLMNQLSNEASEAGRRGGYRGLEGLTSYQQVMEAQKKAQEQPPPGAMGGAPWEGYLQKPGQQPSGPSPWSDLSKWFGIAEAAGKTGQGFYNTMRRNQERELADAREREANRLAEAQRRSEANRKLNAQRVEAERQQRLDELKNPWTLLKTFFSPGGRQTIQEGYTQLVQQAADRNK